MFESRPQAVSNVGFVLAALARLDPVEEPLTDHRPAVLDTYGCGDAFAGGLSASLDVGASLELAARRGTWVASLDGPYGR